MKDNQQEIFPIVDEVGTVIGKATRGECHSGSRLLHPVVHLHVFNSQGDVYLQKRPEWKDIQPGKWDTAVGGHIDYGEKPEDALLREVREELGIMDFQPVSVGKYVFESPRERELVYVHRTTYDGEIRPSKVELDDGRFWTMQEIREAMGRSVFTPNFESEFKRFFLDKIEKYRLLTEQIRALIDGETDSIAVMSNICAAIHETMRFFWTGFYRVIVSWFWGRSKGLWPVCTSASDVVCAARHGSSARQSLCLTLSSSPVTSPVAASHAQRLSFLYFLKMVMS